MNQESIMAMTDANIMNTYRRTPIALVKGEGARVWDAEGRQYLDFIAGIAVCNLGHAHPAVVEAIRRQALDLMHVSNLYYTRPQAEVARILVEHSFADQKINLLIIRHHFHPIYKHPSPKSRHIFASMRMKIWDRTNSNF